MVDIKKNKKTKKAHKNTRDENLDEVILEEEEGEELEDLDTEEEESDDISQTSIPQTTKTPADDFIDATTAAELKHLEDFEQSMGKKEKMSFDDGFSEDD